MAKQMIKWAALIIVVFVSLAGTSISVQAATGDQLVAPNPNSIDRSFSEVISVQTGDSEVAVMPTHKTLP
ncbi:MAG TPA: hypothetical protein EYQ61_00675 [Dehalococcoidia bacterium]|nr:hypothetical protein [Dehalococcoidia bacterium]HIK88522.1 hypothetical protein [Dehalococcoidia bacterium]